MPSQAGRDAKHLHLEAILRRLRLLHQGLLHPHSRLLRHSHLRRQEEGVVADSKQTVGIVERMALGGATSLLPIVPSAPVLSTRAVRPRLAAGAPGGQILRRPQCPRLLRGHLWRNMEG
jgi:hypothetical protein